MLRVSFLVLILAHFVSEIAAQPTCTATNLQSTLKQSINISIPYDTYTYHYITAPAACTTANKCNLIALLDCNTGDDADLFLETVVSAFDPASIPCYEWQSSEQTSDNDGADALIVPNMVAGTTYVVYEQAWVDPSRPPPSTSARAQCQLMVEIDQLSDPQHVQLNQGVPQSGVITPQLGQYQLYKITVPADITQMTASITARQGHPSLSIQPGLVVVPNSGDASTNTTYSAANILTVANPTVGDWSIFVRDTGDLAIYYVTVSFTAANVDPTGPDPPIGSQMLPDGTSLTGNLTGSSDVNYFYYRMSANAITSGYSLTIDLDVMSFGADAGIYVSKSNSTWRPTAAAGGYLWKADSFDSDSLTINPTTPGFCAGCIYTIAVIPRTRGSMSYQIIAHSSRTQALREAETVTSSVRQLAYRYYQFTPQRCTSGEQIGVTLSIQPVTGTVYVYINTDRKHYPTMISSNWTMNEQTGSRQLNISAAAPGACRANADAGGLNICSYVIGVMGQTAETDSSSIQFRLTGTTQCSNGGGGGSGSNVRQPPLRDGSSTTVTPVASGEWIYYQVIIDEQPGPDLAIAMTVFSGDPDMYYRFSPRGLITDLPTLGNYDGAADGSGNDTMLISAAQKGTCFIGVRGFTVAQFSLAVHTYNRSTILIDGIPQSNIVLPYYPNQYTFVVPSASIPRMTLSLFRMIGDPDVFIAFNRTATENDNDGSTNSATGGLIVINQPQKGPYNISVYGTEREGTFYTLTMTTEDASAQLIENRAVSGRISRESNTNDYYFYSLNYRSGALTFALTVFDGDCDLYVSTFSLTPNITNFDSKDTSRNWAGTSYGSDSITIPEATLRVGNYYVGVSAYATCNYRLMVSLNQSILLEDGAAQTGVVPKDGGQYYRVATQINEPFTLLITATPTAGTVVLYVGLNKPDLTDANSDWHSNTWEATPRLNISSQGCSTRCVYYILAQGGSPSGGAYSLVATITAQSSKPVSSQLINGVSTTGQLATEGYAYFYFRDTEHPDSAVVFTVTPDDQGSDPDIYVSSHVSVQQPTPWSAYTKRGATSGADIVTFDKTESLYSIDGQYWISVYAASATSFSVMAQSLSLNGTVYNAPVAMVLSQVKTGFVSNVDKALNAQYYRYTVNLANKSALTVEMTPRFGDPDIFISFVNISRFSSSTPMPNKTHCQYSSTGSTGDTIIIPSTAVCDNDCIMLISVVASTNSLYNLLITSGTSTSVTPLLAGQSMTSSVVANQFKYYYVNVYTGPSVTILLTSISGDPDIYVRRSTNNTQLLPSLNDWEQRSAESGLDMLTLTVTEWPTTVFIGVYGYYAASFSLVAFIGAQQLLPSQPQIGMIGAADVRYYSIDYYQPGTVATPLSFSLIVNSGASVANFYVGAGFIPTVRQHNETALGKTSVTVNAPVNNVRYFLMLQGRADIDHYTIIAQYTKAPIIITANHALTDTLSGTQIRYYHAYVNDPTLDIGIDMMRMFGRVRVLVSDYFKDPEPKEGSKFIVADSKWVGSDRSAHLTLDVSQLRLQQNSANQNVLVIGVWASIASEYSIVYSTASKALMLGSSQPGTVTTRYGKDYFMVSPPSATSPLSITLRGVKGDGSDDYLNITTYTVYSCHSSNEVCLTKINPVGEGTSRSGPLINGQSYDIPLSGSTSIGVYRLAIEASLPVNFTVLATVKGTTNIAQQLTMGLTLVSEKSLTIAPRYYVVNLVTSDQTPSELFVSTCRGLGNLITSAETPNPSPNSPGAVMAELNPSDAEARVSIQSTTGRIYATLLPRSDESGGKEFLYDITYRPYTASPVAAYTYLTMNNQQIRTTPTSDGFTVYYQTARVRPGVTVKYTIYYTSLDDPANIYTVCGCQLIDGDRQILLPDLSDWSNQLEERSWTLSHVAAGRYKVNVVATPVNEFSDSTSVSDLGRPDGAADSGGKSDEGGYSGNVVAAVIIPILIFLIAVLFYLWRKTRKLQAELSGVEMQEAPRSAVLKAMNGAAFRQKAAQFKMKVPRPGSNFKRYNTLLTLAENESSQNHDFHTNDHEIGWEDENEQDNQYNHDNNQSINLDDSNAYSLDSIQELEFDAQQRELSTGIESHEYHQHADMYK